ncbi:MULTISPECIES: hypothetical protein [Limosilactobacillus]|nr:MULTISPECIES: hypothetical protein [Limosilactobacillus]
MEFAPLSRKIVRKWGIADEKSITIQNKIDLKVFIFLLEYEVK